MSLPLASAPVAVLVLAWDETTPAVRALVEPSELTGPALDSVVVLVPAGPATTELTPEEFLPLTGDDLLAAALVDNSPAAPAPEATPLAAEAAPNDSLPVLAATAAVAPTAAAAAAASLADAHLQDPLPATDEAATSTLLSAANLAELPPSRPTVRMLRLSTYSLAELATQAQQALPAPAWVGAGSLPAAPYLGSSAAPQLATALLLSPATVADFALALAPVLAGSEPALTPSAGVLPGAALPARRHLPTEPAAPDAEADTTPDDAPEELLAAAEASTTEQLAAAAEASEAASPAAPTPVQAGWPEALASLQAPAAFVAKEKPTAADLAAFPLSTALPAPAASEPAAPTPSALVPAADSFDAPNLNFQIIQYARFAVPLALANEPFAVIYAPAWPTWLAAQELRQRTGRPLVLHVAALAAEEEPLELAVGWPAEIQRQALHRADLILTETPALAYRLRQELSLPAHRVRPVPAADAAAVAQALGTVQAH